MPFEESAPSDERQQCPMPVRVRGQFEGTFVREVAVRVHVGPELAHRQQRVAHGRNTANVGEGEVNKVSVRVASCERQISNRHTRAQLAIHAGDRVGAWTNIGKVAHVGMDVVCATTVDYESDVSPTLVQAAGMSIAEACGARGG
eukprot:102421-Pleurochrysis_carterae.AAC.1